LIENYEEIYNQKYTAQEGLCEVCKRNLFMGRPQLAHRIEDAKHWRRKYGKEIINHSLNLALVCDLGCNSSVLIGKKDRLREELVLKIKKTMEKTK